MDADEQQIRVSVGVYARVRTDDGLWNVLVDTGRGFRPLGGAVQYRETTKPALESVKFRREHPYEPDLRGRLPRRRLDGFKYWLGSGEDREGDGPALLREVAEELAEIGHPELAANVRATYFVPAYVVTEETEPTEREPWWQFRRLAVFDLTAVGTVDVAFRDRLVALAHDPTERAVVAATAVEIGRGRLSTGQNIAPQAKHLVAGTARLAS
ncbi:hypothetical protein ALI22I_20210 [Saccharothrix sp. ALI-22-I]|uniref:SMODS-associated NUDIX domain-containing protein n=1 Tax=Saccharothrix sp. ALI-22-I TaxID=1933778 RepID=UPI00097BE9CD|nr:hypothetical protein [Saccharothrix sp. ALI-22-I]ONI88066.1 hypothetical protein ALI22I_20210 [Saccharothrix sp. ALI-22-I]